MNNIVVNFITDSTVLPVTLTEDNATTRSFIAMLPMTVKFEDFHNQEKIVRKPLKFDYSDAHGMTPKPGDLFSYRPWSNLGFFYDTESLGFDNNLVLLGHTDNVADIVKLEGQEVTIKIAD